ncbi:hypothetical protein SARC_02702 [Sphaeroforma arctica JP610]|uniref:Uncharacterized protein n=1 Tax=Sphaeroforma arctica JP610 TaxID=667725 RepID=A0A0L0G7W2_9EUKA|nr:hypothetical protein SARC_02702 [Sphaeroforma arctica JP610]KNC85112.1 hypothetical protein SARC_02702 [Sphaeroforma arctica JP610]|eukprot:XP_014159014.1 hypothetical protein SARC_02702 [Sphaeroforma arctica JP610]
MGVFGRDRHRFAERAGTHAQTDHTPTPQTDHTPTTQTDHTPTPQTDHTHTPQTDQTPAPQTDHTHTPQTDHTHTPQTDHAHSIVDATNEAHSATRMRRHRVIEVTHTRAIGRRRAAATYSSYIGISPTLVTREWPFEPKREGMKCPKTAVFALRLQTCAHVEPN